MPRTLDNLGPVVSDNDGGWICGLCVDSHASYRGAVNCRRDAKRKQLEQGAPPARESTPPPRRRSSDDDEHLRAPPLRPRGFGFLWAVQVGAGLMLGAALMYLALLLAALALGALIGASILQTLQPTGG